MWNPFRATPNPLAERFSQTRAALQQTRERIAVLEEREKWLKEKADNADKLVAALNAENKDLLARLFYLLRVELPDVEVPSSTKPDVPLDPPGPPSMNQFLADAQKKAAQFDHEVNRDRAAISLGLNKEPKTEAVNAN